MVLRTVVSEVRLSQNIVNGTMCRLTDLNTGVRSGMVTEL